jgi:hypothetical protein
MKSVTCHPRRVCYRKSDDRRSGAAAAPQHVLTMELLLSLAVGIGLSAACGFRVFVPLLIAGIAARTGHLELASGFEWMASTPALVAFGTATLLEISAYYIPWLDNALDTVATPAAVIAGTLITASLVADLGPFLKWTLAVMAGGGAAGLIQGGTVLTRGISTTTTAGLGNPVVATAELGGSVTTAILAVLAPFLALLLLLLLVSWMGWVAWRRSREPLPTPKTP